MACIFMLLLVVVILARLVHLQIIKHGHFTTLSQENRLKVVPLAPPRGRIYSRDGVVLAENRPSFSLDVIPENANDLEQALTRLAELLELSDDEIDAFQRQLKLSRRFENVTLKSDLSDEAVAKFSVNRHLFPGFFVAAGSVRHYPLADKTAHVLGYVARISESDLKKIDPSNYAATTHIGKSGVEKSREDLLHGEVGYQTVEVNAQGRILRVVERTPPVAGADLYLTLDVGLQGEAIDALGERKGAIVVLDPNSGGIQVFASTPAFDPNLFVNGIGRDTYRALNQSPSRPLFNRALQGQYPPGSTIKPMVALGGLEYGLREGDDITWCPGWFSLPGHSHRYRDWLKRGHGQVSLKTSIAHSCDVYYYKLAQEMGIKRLHAALSPFGFGAITGVDIPGESSGLLPSPEWKRRARKLPWYPGETLITGIGQGFMLATPLQLAHATAIVALRGDVRIPHFLGEIEHVDGSAVSMHDTFRREPVAVKQAQHWQAIIDGMVEVVHGPTGTARRSGAGAPVRFAGKTGTAQVFGIKQNQEADDLEIPEHLLDHALFVAFAPVEAPQIAIAIIVENGGGGSRTAAPIARRLIDYYFGQQATEEVAPSG